MSAGAGAAQDGERAKNKKGLGSKLFAEMETKTKQREINSKAKWLAQRGWKHSADSMRSCLS